MSNPALAQLANLQQEWVVENAEKLLELVPHHRWLNSERCTDSRFDNEDSCMRCALLFMRDYGKVKYRVLITLTHEGDF